MAWMIGIDEAGYGPNLGPLVIGATAWHIDEPLAPSATTIAPPINLYHHLAQAVVLTPDGTRLAIADSKQLYKPGSGLALVERGVLTALTATNDRTPQSWNELIHASGADADQLRTAIPWYQDFDCALPIDDDPEEIAAQSNRFTTACGFAGVKPVTMRARLVFPAEFNKLTEHYGTKGAALSHVSIGLLREVIEQLAEVSGEESTFITCDKHGGRNRYGALLQHHFPHAWINTVEECRASSRYQWGNHEICFRTKGEAELPVALASMTAKYLRELAMRAFNAFWQDKLPNLRPTAGYPQDAKRFKAEIAAVQCELGIEDNDLWRNR